MGLRTQSAPHPRAATGPGGNGQLPVLSLRLGCVFSLDALPGFPTAASLAASAHHYALSQWDLVQEASQTPSPPGQGPLCPHPSGGTTLTLRSTSLALSPAAHSGHVLMATPPLANFLPSLTPPHPSSWCFPAQLPLKVFVLSSGFCRYFWGELHFPRLCLGGTECYSCSHPGAPPSQE